MFIALLLCLLISTPHQTWAMASRGNQVIPPLVGQEAPEFSLQMTDGKVRTLSQVRDGKKAIIMFWATWCPHCQTALVRLSYSLKEKERNGIKVILVNMADSLGDTKAYLQFHQIGAESFLDYDNSLQGPYQIYGVPTFYTVDEKGIVQSLSNEVPGSTSDLFPPRPKR